jgi:hypothetical protein
MKLGLYGKTTCQKEDYWFRSGLVESEESLQVHLVILSKDLLFLGCEHKGGKPRKEDRNSKHSLNPERGSRVSPVSLAKACMEDSKHSSPMS